MICVSIPAQVSGSVVCLHFSLNKQLQKKEILLTATKGWDSNGRLPLLQIISFLIKNCGIHKFSRSPAATHQEHSCHTKEH